MGPRGWGEMEAGETLAKLLWGQRLLFEEKWEISMLLAHPDTQSLRRREHSSVYLSKCVGTQTEVK